MTDHQTSRAAFVVSSPDAPEVQQKFAASRGCKGGRILRVSDVTWSPGDDFCTIWPMFDLLPEGPAGWMPKLRYPAEAPAKNPGSKECH